MTSKIYIAGPLFTPGERWFLEQIDKELRDSEILTYLPHRDAGICPASGKGSQKFFQKDVEALRNAAAVVAVLNGPDVDAGTAWEIGFAFCLEVPVFGFVDDTRIAKPQADINLMIFHSVTLFTSFSKLKNAILDLRS